MSGSTSMHMFALFTTDARDLFSFIRSSIGSFCLRRFSSSPGYRRLVATIIAPRRVTFGGGLRSLLCLLCCSGQSLLPSLFLVDYLSLLELIFNGSRSGVLTSTKFVAQNLFTILLLIGIVSLISIHKKLSIINNYLNSSTLTFPQRMCHHLHLHLPRYYYSLQTTMNQILVYEADYGLAIQLLCLHQW